MKINKSDCYLLFADFDDTIINYDHFFHLRGNCNEPILMLRNMK